MKIRVLLFIIQLLYLLFGNSIAKAKWTASGHSIVHGDDNRVTPAQYIDEDIIDLSKSVALVTNRSKIHSFNEKHFVFSAPNLGEKLNLCDGVPFAKEPSLGNCTSFLIDSNKVATAGHCVTKENEGPRQLERICRRLRFVFNFTSEELAENKESTGKSKTIKKTNVFNCKKILKYEYKKTKYRMKDFAIIELDRHVKNAPPLRHRRFGRPLMYTPMVVIGHPSGIPLKISGEAKLKPLTKEDDENYFQAWMKKRDIFYANLDTFSGNSGSPVINAKTKKVEGIFIGGDEEDYIIDDGTWCRRPKVKSNSSSETKEYVQRIKVIRPYLKK